MEQGDGSHTSKCELRGLPGGSTKTKSKEIMRIDKLRPNDREGEGPWRDLGNRFKTNL